MVPVADVIGYAAASVPASTGTRRDTFWFFAVLSGDVHRSVECGKSEAKPWLWSPGPRDFPEGAIFMDGVAMRVCPLGAASCAPACIGCRVLVEYSAIGGYELRCTTTFATTGYGLHRQLAGLGHVCDVVAVDDSKTLWRSVKTNHRDAVTLVKLLRAGELGTVGCSMSWRDAVHPLLGEITVKTPDPGRDLVNVRF